MTTLTTADVRKMVDDLDDIIRGAVYKGDGMNVFKRERANFVSNPQTDGIFSETGKKKNRIRLCEQSERTKTTTT